jgi:hypothetical protein
LTATVSELPFICMLLHQFLQESSRWQVVLRSLAALEAVLQRGSNQACGEVAVMFQSDPEPIRACLQSPQQQVQEKAASVLKLLLGEDVVVPAAAASSKASGKGTAAAAAAKAPAMDLLIDDSPSEPAAAAAAAAAPASAAAGIDLLGDLSSPAAAAAPPAPAAAAAVDALFDGLGVSSGAAAAAAAAPAAAGDDMFGGLTVAAPVPAAAPAAAVSRPAPLDDLLSGLTVGGSSSSPAANGNSASLLSGFSPVKQQQQPQLMGMQPMQQQQQQQQLQLQPDLLGDFSMAGRPQQQQMMLQQQLGLGMQPQLQVRGLVRTGDHWCFKIGFVMQQAKHGQHCDTDCASDAMVRFFRSQGLMQCLALLLTCVCIHCNALPFCRPRPLKNISLWVFCVMQSIALTSRSLANSVYICPYIPPTPV